jgi:hypothetical protein
LLTSNYAESRTQFAEASPAANQHSPGNDIVPAISRAR